MNTFVINSHERLRPLNFVIAEGPAIENCIGIYKGLIIFLLENYSDLKTGEK